MDKTKIKDLFCCPICKGILTIKQNSLLCNTCGEIGHFDNNLIDFKASEQKFENNWSKDTPQEETEQWVNDLLSGSFLTEADLANIATDLNTKPVKEAFELGRSKIQSVFYLDRNQVIVDLASGMASLFNEKLDYQHLAGKTIILTDLSKAILSKVRDRLAKEASSCSFFFVVCNAAALPIRDSSVDFISSNSVFGNAEDGKKIISEVYRALKPNSQMLVLEQLSEENSRTIRLRDKLKSGDLASKERMQQELILAKFNNIEINNLYQGKAHLAGDLIPLKDDLTMIAVISAEKSGS